jgi:hypothetical protein
VAAAGAVHGLQEAGDGWLQVLAGSAHVGDTALAAGDGLGWQADAPGPLVAGPDGARLLWIALAGQAGGAR